jgi:hypothetical protein
MKTIAILAGLALALPAMADDSRSGAPLRATLIGYEEVPAVDTVAEGTFEARIARDEKSVDYTLTYSGLQAPVIMSHIHFGQKSVNGSIIVWLCGTTANPGPAGTATCPGTGGTVTGTFTSANVGSSSITTQQFKAGDLASLIDAIRSGIAYVNVHSNLSPGGEIRGQIRTHGQED